MRGPLPQKHDFFLNVLPMQLLQLYFTFFFLLTPFFVLSVFLTMTEESSLATKRTLSLKIATGASCICLIIFFGGAWLMHLFGITVDAFRAGSGVLLLLVAIRLVYGSNSSDGQHHKTDAELLKDAVVPLAVPITAGPATLGTLIVMGLEQTSWQEKLITAAAMVMACWTIGMMLFFSGNIARFIGRTNIAILSKITGLILSAIAMSMIVTRVHALWLASE